MLKANLDTISEKCTNCEFCQQECTFLQENLKPKQIADSYDANNKKHQGMAFECNLCQLCVAVCPADINPAELFLEMRRETVRNGNDYFAEHDAILRYEKRGTSKRYSYYALPEGCDTVFFPGCTLPGTRPDKTWALFEHLRETVPTLGIVMDCCTKPSYDLGREEYFSSMFGEMKDYLINNGIRNVLVACPNCYKIFIKYGEKLSVETIYEFFAQNGLPTKKQISATVTVHDPCGVRHDSSIHAAVRNLCKQIGISIEEMPHHKDKTFCCGEGGSVGLVTPDYAKKWGALRKSETNGNRIVTYCAGCADFLGKITPTCHVLDLVFEPQATMAGQVKVSRAPWTYFNRIKLKKRFMQTLDAPVSRERIFSAGKNANKGTMVKRLLFFAAFFTLIFVSSSLLDLLKGGISPAFMSGLVLLALVFLTPFLYNRYKNRKGTTDPL